MQKAELAAKMEPVRSLQNISGNVWWPGYALTRNTGGVADSLVTVYQSSIALPPASTWISADNPVAPVGSYLEKGNVIKWDEVATVGTTSDVVRYVVYRFDDLEDVDIDSAEAIVAVTPDHQFKAERPGVYVVTALDRVNNESAPSVALQVL